jgi:hypothetical protein
LHRGSELLRKVVFPVPFLVRQPFGLLSAESMLLALSGVIRQISRLESEGLVWREPCPGDRRGAYAILAAPLPDLELGPELLLEEPEEALLLGAYLLHVDLVEAGFDVLADGRKVLLGVRATG